MKVILTKDHKELGKKDDVVTVKDGYGQNFLIGKGLAILASEANIQRRNERVAEIQKEKEISLKASYFLKSTIDDLTLCFEREGNGMKMFGAVTNIDISKELENLDIHVPKNQIKLNKIYGFGEFTADVDCGNQITTKLSIYIDYLN